MGRILRTIVTSAAALLLLVGAAWWVRSYFAADYAFVHIGDPAGDPVVFYTVQAERGGVYAWRIWRSGFRSPGAPQFGYGTRSGPSRVGTMQSQFAGFAVGKHDLGGGRGFNRDGTVAATLGGTLQTYARVPFWFIELVLLAITARGVWVIRRGQRVAPTACRNCGYDLRTGHDKCPECGATSHVQPGPAEAHATNGAS